MRKKITVFTNYDKEHQAVIFWLSDVMHCSFEKAEWIMLRLEKMGQVSDMIVIQFRLKSDIIKPSCRTGKKNLFYDRCSNHQSQRPQTI